MENHMILSTIRMTIPSRKRGEALKILRSLAAQSRADPGCLSFHIYEDLQEKNVLMIEEAWRAEEELDLHIRSDKYREVLLVLEMARNPPEIRFDRILKSTGIETVENIRCGA
jgi:quinol monooxygenase YgiN